MFYVYIHKRSTDGTVFYVGKGQKDRAFQKKNRSRKWQNIAKKNGYEVEIVKNFETEKDAFVFERELIAEYGMENLANLTSGGEGASDRILSEEFFEKMRLWAGSEKNRERVSKQWKGVKRSKENIEKLRIARTGRIVPDSEIPKMREAQKRQMKPIICIDTGHEFECIFYAAEWLRSQGKAKKSVEVQLRHVCKGRMNTAGGYRWKYKE